MSDRREILDYYRKHAKGKISGVPYFSHAQKHTLSILDNVPLLYEELKDQRASLQRKLQDHKDLYEEAVYLEQVSAIQGVEEFYLCYPLVDAEKPILIALCRLRNFQVEVVSYDLVMENLRMIYQGDEKPLLELTSKNPMSLLMQLEQYLAKKEVPLQRVKGQVIIKLKGTLQEADSISYGIGLLSEKGLSDKNLWSHYLQGPPFNSELRAIDAISYYGTFLTDKLLTSEQVECLLAQSNHTFHCIKGPARSGKSTIVVEYIAGKLVDVARTLVHRWDHLVTAEGHLDVDGLGVLLVSEQEKRVQKIMEMAKAYTGDEPLIKSPQDILDAIDTFLLSDQENVYQEEDYLAKRAVFLEEERELEEFSRQIEVLLQRKKSLGDAIYLSPAKLQEKEGYLTDEVDQLNQELKELRERVMDLEMQIMQHHKYLEGFEAELAQELGQSKRLSQLKNHKLIRWIPLVRDKLDLQLNQLAHKRADRLEKVQYSNERIKRLQEEQYEYLSRRDYYIETAQSLSRKKHELAAVMTAKRKLEKWLSHDEMASLDVEQLLQLPVITQMRREMLEQAQVIRKGFIHKHHKEIKNAFSTLRTHVLLMQSLGPYAPLHHCQEELVELWKYFTLVYPVHFSLPQVLGAYGIPLVEKTYDIAIAWSESALPQYVAGLSFYRAKNGVLLGSNFDDNRSVRVSPPSETIKPYYHCDLYDSFTLGVLNSPYEKYVRGEKSPIVLRSCFEDRDRESLFFEQPLDQSVFSPVENSL